MPVSDATVRWLSLSLSGEQLSLVCTELPACSSSALLGSLHQLQMASEMWPSDCWQAGNSLLLLVLYPLLVKVPSDAHIADCHAHYIGLY